jgi:RNA polymerase subunit RPABC4/transcription elongation factor Spt4
LSDNFQILAFDTVSANEAASIGDMAIRWMINAEYISGFRTECVFSEDSLGYSPGPNAIEIVDIAREFRGLRRPAHVFIADEAMADTKATRINGVRSTVGHAVFTAGQNASGFDGGVCPACGTRNVREDVEDILVAHASAWFDRRPSKLMCPACGHSFTLEDWDFEPYWAFSELAMEFWNWPILSENFLTGMKRATGISRIRQIVGRL